MTRPYDVKTIDAVLQRSIEVEDSLRREFYAGEIPGGGPVPTGSPEVKLMLERISRWNSDLIENLGMDAQNITYFRVGAAAREVMRRGGVGALARRAQVAGALKASVPIAIALLAAAISTLSWLKPREPAHRGEDELKARLAELDSSRAMADREILGLRASLDSLRGAPRSVSRHTR